VSDDDGLVAHQDLFDDKADDPLMFLDVEGVSSGPLPIREARAGLCQAQLDGAVVCLLED